MGNLEEALEIGDEMASLIQCECYVDKNGDVRHEGGYPQNLGKCHPCKVLEKWELIRNYLKVSPFQEA